MRRSVRLLSTASHDVKLKNFNSNSRNISLSVLSTSSPAISTFECQVKVEKLHQNDWTPLCSTRELSCALTLESGQVFTWRKHPKQLATWLGVIGRRVFALHEREDIVHFQCLHPLDLSTIEGAKVLSHYFRLEVNADPLYECWTMTSDRMTESILKLRGLRIVRQDPVECLFSFICSSNNNIARIQGMVDRLKATYGDLIYKEEDEQGCDFYAFPSVDTLATKCEEATLRTLGFGYRAAFIVKTAKQLQALGGAAYLNNIRDGKTIVSSKMMKKLKSSKVPSDEQEEKMTSYHAYQDDLMVFAGVGRKVADCVALFSLEKMEAIPVDTHVWQIACRELDATLSKRKSITPTVYRMVGDLFRTRFIRQAGWAHSILFAADLTTFKSEVVSIENKSELKCMAVKTLQNSCTKRKTVFSLLVTSTFGSQRRLQTYTQTSDYEAIMLERVNLERGAQGLAPLCTNSKLRLAAQLHSDDQAANDFMDHTGSDGRTVVDRVSAAGYDWRGVAENVAAGQIDVTEVMDAWMNSEGHRENILGDYTMLGSAYAYTPDGNYNHFWTQNFGWSDTDVCDGMTPTSNGPNTTSLISDPVANSRGNVSKLLVTLNRYVYMDSPLSLFAFKSMEFLTLEDLQGHALYNLYADFERMGVALKDGTSAYRVTELNATFVMCPTYPRQLVVPAAASDVEVGAVASFRSKGRLPICSYVHAHNGAALWRCAQPKRGILHAQNDADENYLLHIARASSSSTSSYSGTRTRKIWIADCRPELNARVNNLTGGGTESGNLAHARVSFLNIGNIHAMRESIEAVRGLGGFMASTNNTESTDLLWGARVEDTKWLLHVRRILSGALQVAHALEAQATTVVVHCSDGWDRTAQLCGLAQLLVDGHYRSRRGFLEVIEKEWVRAGHKFQDRVAPGKTEDDDQQAPIFLQFLDCVWQLIRIFPTHFEFNERMLETMADAVFSGRYGTFLGNCECERGTWSVRERTPSLYASILRDDRYVNPFYRGSSTAALLPEPSSVLRQVTLWSSYYFRGAPFLASSAGNPAPPMYAVTVEGEGNAVSSGAQEDMEIAMMAALRRIRVLEDKLSTAAAMSAPPPGPSPVSYPPLYSAASELGMCARVHQNSQPEMPIHQNSQPEMPIHQNSQPEMPIHQNSQPEMPIHQQSFKDDFHHSSSNCSSTSSDGGVYAAPALPVLPQVSTLSFSTPAPVSVQPSVPTATWTCRLCTKSNAAGVLQCVVCGRTPR
ncbi:unnamed protein product [Peronospora belbahrii]|uniref:Myotubularin phosphatase domain-containing protein n=1 Tax=Peronospora belbahrii TaxID=622444 RepID=A0ABN8DC00_9STRA|nr:unnamed protein product [Peronospora belbahrii]